MAVEEIRDPADPRLADYRCLRDVELRVHHETTHGVFIAESPRVVRALLDSRYPVRSVLLTPRRWTELADDLRDVDAPVYLAPRWLLREVTGVDLHRGALACGERLPLPDPDEVLCGAQVVAVLEGLNDHENLGVLFRAARALGVDAVLLDPACCDPLYRRCVRVSMGHVLHLPWTRVGPVDGLLDELRRRGFTSVALTPDPSAVPIDTLPPPDRVAVVVGAEGPGLRPATLAAADVRCRIPMRAGVDSLNVATAAAIAFHRLGRVG